MSERNGSTATLPRPEDLRIEVTDVTGTRTVLATDIQPGLPAGTVASALAHRMSLPTDVPWTLRDEKSSAFLDERRPIGDQLDPSARVTITPKTHLG